MSDMYNAARRAVDDVLNTQFVRQGDLAHKVFGDSKGTYRGVLEYTDQNFLSVTKRIDELERALRDTQAEQTKTIKWIDTQVANIWGGIFAKYSMSGRGDDTKPGILPVLEKLAEKYGVK